MLGFQQNVLVLSSWRSGSTFTGDMLTHYPGTYYLYEPIWAFHETVSQGWILNFYKKNCKNVVCKNCQFEGKGPQSKWKGIK